MLIEFVQKFNSENACLQYLTKMRWNDKIVCPYCDEIKIYHFKDGARYKCACCKRVFNAKIGTIFHNTKIPLTKWFVAIYLITSHKKGISSIQLGKDLGITQKTAWGMLQKIRSVFSDEEVLSGLVELDETYVGGKEKNKHKNKRTKGTQGRSVLTKSAILGMLERNGKVKAIHVKDVTVKTMKPVIGENVKSGSHILTDEFQNYTKLKGYRHSFCNHSAKQYVCDEVHTNGLENFWSLAKRAIFGIYHWVSAKYMQNYFDEFCFRYNTRGLTEIERVEYLLKKVA